MLDTESKKDLELVQKLVEARKSINDQLSKIIVGQKSVIDELLVSLFAARTLSDCRCAGTG